MVLGIRDPHKHSRSCEGVRRHSRSVFQSFLKEKAVEHSESLKTCADGASKPTLYCELLGMGQAGKDPDK